jgi:predicted DNA-binding transcriptional regulator YafY
MLPLGYVLDRSMTLPPLNFTPVEAVAMAVAQWRLDDTPWARDARTALRKVVAAMPEGWPHRPHDYFDVGGRPTVREVERHHVVLGPNGSYVTG